MADIDRVELYLKKRLLDPEPQWRWRYVAAGNHARLANGGEAYGAYTDCATAAGRVVGFDIFNRDSVDRIETRGNRKTTTQVFLVDRFGGGKLEVWMVTPR